MAAVTKNRTLGSDSRFLHISPKWLGLTEIWHGVNYLSVVKFWWKFVDPCLSYCPFWMFFFCSWCYYFKKSSPQKLLYRIQWKLTFLFYRVSLKKWQIFDCWKNMAAVSKNRTMGSDSRFWHTSPGLANSFQLLKWSLL